MARSFVVGEKGQFARVVMISLIAMRSMIGYRGYARGAHGK
ncbi:hypothetical protein [Caballeronia zhejiangensis]|nr:hypothetical protein [Caballeronia zhejiangensis]